MKARRVCTIGELLERDHGVMAKKVAMAKKLKRSRLADDIIESLNELRDFVAGKKTNVIVRTVVPSAVKARKARHILGLSQPKAVRRALKSQMVS